MWQRIQTLYIFIATALIAAMFFCKKTADLDIIAYTPYLVLLIIITLFNIIALSTYKHRILQMRTCVMSALISLALQIWLGVDYFTAGSDTVFYITVLFPLAAIVCSLLAAKNIFSDELMVRSSSRLRSRKK